MTLATTTVIAAWWKPDVARLAIAAPEPAPGALGASMPGTMTTAPAGWTTPLPEPGAPTSGFHFTIAGTHGAGTYDVESPRPTCTFGTTGAGWWHNQFSDPASPLTAVELSVPNAAAAAHGKGPFALALALDAVRQGGQSYVVDTRVGSPSGNGTITVWHRGRTAVMRITARTADGVGIDGVIVCHEVRQAA
jgi:hypothetical protein